MALSNFLADRVINNMYLYHIYSLAEIIIMIPLIESFNLQNRRAGVVAVSGYFIFWLFNIFYLEPLSNYNSISSSVTDLVIAFFCLRYFLLISKSETVLYFQKVPAFWIVSAFLFYSIASVLLTGTYRFASQLKDINSHTLWKIHQTINIIKFVIISIGIICSYRLKFQDG